MKNKLLIFFLFLFNSIALAQLKQIDSVYLTKEIVVTSNRLTKFAIGNKIEEIDSAIIAQNNTNTLAELLSNNSQVYIKSYSIAGLSTPSFRGMNASQTAVIWNGFNIGNSMNGGQDFSLLPVNFVNSIKVQFGGSGALWGSGAIGGSIHLTNKPIFNKGISVNTTSSIGSFNDQQYNIEVGFSKTRWISNTKLFYHSADNNYPFLNVAKFNHPTEKMQNAAFAQKGLLQENYFKITPNQNLSIRFWHQLNHRQIPSSITSGISNAKQDDHTTRGALEWQLQKSKISVFARAGLLNEILIFKDPQISVNSKSDTRTFIVENEAKINVGSNQFINIGINYTYNTAFTKNYNFVPKQHRTSLFGSYQVKNKKGNFNATSSIRQEFISNGLQPFTASLGTELIILKHWRLRANSSRNYRIPTFNDLYWAQGGNPNLVPEEGYNEEIGLAFVHCKEKFAIENEVTVFNSNVNNWIMWTPDHKGIWSPENILKVWSRGIENDFKIYYTIGKLKLSTNIHYQYILTTNDGNDSPNPHLNKQLIYTPTHKAFSNISAQVQKFRCTLLYNYVGFRYTSADNSTFLDPYQTLGLDLSQTYNFKKYNIKVFLQINNLNNASYQIYTYYPSPMRSYQLGISIHFNQPSKP